LLFLILFKFICKGVCFFFPPFVLFINFLRKHRGKARLPRGAGREKEALKTPTRSLTASSCLLPAGLLLCHPAKPINPPSPHRSSCQRARGWKWPLRVNLNIFPFSCATSCPRAWARREAAPFPAPQGCAEWDGTPCPCIAALGETPVVEATGEGGLSLCWKWPQNAPLAPKSCQGMAMGVSSPAPGVAAGLACEHSPVLMLQGKMIA